MAIPVMPQKEWNKIQKQVDKYEHVLFVVEEDDKNKTHYRASTNISKTNFLLFVIELIKELFNNIKEEDIIRTKQYLLKEIMNIFNNTGEEK